MRPGQALPRSFCRGFPHIFMWGGQALVAATDYPCSRNSSRLLLALRAILPVMRLGPLTLPSNLFLSPLAGYTNLPFRLAVRELGGLGLATTDLVNARSLLEKKPKALKLIETCPADRPLAVQLFGSVPEEMRDAARLLESLGIASVDINMGCPVRKVCRVGGGSAMMTELDKTARLVKGMVDAVKIPVTAKMRLGWDDENITAPDLARALEDVGVAAIFVHGRTRAQGFSGTVNLAGIRAVVQALQDTSRHRQRRRHHPPGRQSHARPDRLRRRQHRPRRLLQPVDFPAHARTTCRPASSCPNPPSRSACASCAGTWT